MDTSNQHDLENLETTFDFLPTKCYICKEDFSSPVLLNCLHVLDKTCLESSSENDNIYSDIRCPICEFPCANVDSLEPFHIDSKEANIIEVQDNGDQVDNVKCTLCTTNAVAHYKCEDCAETLCKSCQHSHKILKMFSSHMVSELTHEDKLKLHELNQRLNMFKPMPCKDHLSEMYRYYCFQCGRPVCQECMVSDHKAHVACSLEDAPVKLNDTIHHLVAECHNRLLNFKESKEILTNFQNQVNSFFEENESRIQETAKQLAMFIEQINDEFLRRNKEFYEHLNSKVSESVNKTEKTMGHISYCIGFISSYMEKSSPLDMIKTSKVVIACLEYLSKLQINMNMPNCVTFSSDLVTLKDSLDRKFGWFDGKPHMISSPPNVPSTVSFSAFNGFSSNADTNVNDVLDNIPYIPFQQESILNGGGVSALKCALSAQLSPPDSGESSLGSLGSANKAYLKTGQLDNVGILGMSNSNNNQLLVNQQNRIYNCLNMDSGIQSLSRANTPANSIIDPTSSISIDSNLLNFGHAYSNPSNVIGSLSSGVNNLTIDSSGNSVSNHSAIVPTSKPSSTTLAYNPHPNPPFPNRSGRCHAMNVRNRWGSLGSNRDQLSSPHGFCLGFDEDIVVADTQNHRIQIFDKNGVFKSQFGVSGREEGQLWYPRKVAIMRESQRYVVCDRGNERSRMQIFTRSGHFIRKISIRYIDIVAGLAIDFYGHIVAVDSVSPSVFIISDNGELVKWFDCSDYMREPSDIAISGREYYVCDFKGHCVAVFQEDGQFLRRIGSETITNFPNGIDVSDAGDVLIGDSHGNRFHIAVYTSQGVLTSEFECPQVKVSRCCGLKITSEGYVVTLAKNNHHVLVLDTLYIA